MSIRDGVRYTSRRSCCACTFYVGYPWLPQTSAFSIFQFHNYNFSTGILFTHDSIDLTSNQPHHKDSSLPFAPILPGLEASTRTCCLEAECIIPTLESILTLSVRRPSFGTNTGTNGCVMKMLANLFCSCAHDSCRWYQDYRNATKKFTVSKSSFLCWLLPTLHLLSISHTV